MYGSQVKREHSPRLPEAGLGSCRPICATSTQQLLPVEPTALSGPQQALSRANPEQREKGEFEEKHSILSLLGKTADPTDERAVTFKCVCAWGQRAPKQDGKAARWRCVWCLTALAQVLTCQDGATPLLREHLAATSLEIQWLPTN